MRSRLLILGGLLLIATGIAHALVAWPLMRRALESYDCPDELIGDLAAGWTFGSVALITFGFLVVCDGWRARSGQRVAIASSTTIGAALVAFGVMSWMMVNLRPHFLAYVGLGLLVGLPCLIHSHVVERRQAG
jgi:small-conductance mechanosensitive channel